MRLAPVSRPAQRLLREVSDLMEMRFLEVGARNVGTVEIGALQISAVQVRILQVGVLQVRLAQVRALQESTPQDRKSTRLLQSLMRLSYAVFCLQKQNKREKPNTTI